MLEKTFDLIDISYFEDVSLKKAALVSNLSIQHFCRLFKKTTGMTFNDYLSFYRVNRAEKLLHSQKKITEIALECGFWVPSEKRERLVKAYADNGRGDLKIV